jgi:hypothetical protein
VILVASENSKFGSLAMHAASTRLSATCRNTIIMNLNTRINSHKKDTCWLDFSVCQSVSQSVSQPVHSHYDDIVPFPSALLPSLAIEQSGTGIDAPRYRICEGRCASSPKAMREAYGNQFPRSPSRMRQFAWLARSDRRNGSLPKMRRCAHNGTLNLPGSTRELSCIS